MLMIALAFAASTGVTIGAASHAASTPPATVAVECPAFKANKDGSWTSIRSTKVGTVSISSGGTFFPGVQLDGVDLGAQLNAQCRQAAKADAGH